MKSRSNGVFRYGRLLLMVALLGVSTTAAAWEVFVDRGESRLISHPGAGAGGAHVSAVPADGGPRGYSAGSINTHSLRVSNYSGLPVTGSSMHVRRITFFAYQRDSGTTSTITGVNLQVWTWGPLAEGRRLIYGDLTTNRMVHTEFANIYRVDPAQDPLTDTSRPIMKVVAEVDFHMPASGTQYFIDWQLTGSKPNNGPWVPPVLEVSGQVDRAYHYATDEWVLATGGPDDLPQSLPFIIEGEYSDGVWCTSLDQTITGSAEGTHLRLRDGLVGAEADVPDGNLVIYDDGGLSFRWLGSQFPEIAWGSSENDEWAVLQPGDVVNDYTLKRYSGPATLWRDGVDGYLGFRVGCGTAVSCYGFLRMKTAAGTPGKPGFPVQLREVCHQVGSYAPLMVGPRFHVFDDRFEQ